MRTSPLLYASVLALMFTMFSCTTDSVLSPDQTDKTVSLNLDEAQDMIPYDFDLAALRARAKAQASTSRSSSNDPVQDWDTGDVVGSSHITRHTNSVTVNVATTPDGMTLDPAGHAITLWGFSFASDGSFSGGYLNGKVISNNGDISISGVIHNVFDPETASVIIILRSHGEKIAAFMPGMIQTFCGGCICGDDGPDGPSGPNTCSDFAIAFH